MASAIGPVGSSSRAGSILETLSGLILADLYAAEIRPNIALLKGLRYFWPNIWPIAWPILRKPDEVGALYSKRGNGGPCRSRPLSWLLVSYHLAVYILFGWKSPFKSSICDWRRAHGGRN
jgi:hypothetical protein